MTFVSKKVKGDHSKGYTVTGALNIRHVIKSVTSEITPVKGTITDDWKTQESSLWQPQLSTDKILM